MFNEIFTEFLDKVDGFDSFFNGVASVKTDYNLVYGEYNIDSFSTSLDILQDFNYTKGDKKLLDLGSGIGKVVIPMHYTGYFKQVDGIELVDSLIKDSEMCIDAYRQLFNKDISNINIYQGDFLKMDISDYDILISNTTTDNEIRALLKDKISREAKKGAIVISSISSFETKQLKQIRKCTTRFSWGVSSIIACVKI